MDCDAAVAKVGRDIQKARADYGGILRSVWKKVRSERKKPGSFARRLSSCLKTIESGELFAAGIDMSALSINVSDKFDFDVGEAASLPQDLLIDASNEAKNQVA